MTDGGDLSPVRIVPFPNGELGIVWQDGHESFYPGHDLRCACRCASCIDELSGKKLLNDSDVPEDVHVRAMHPVGNYGISFEWSDGHDQGIYTFELLRGWCPCCVTKAEVP